LFGLPLWLWVGIVVVVVVVVMRGIGVGAWFGCRGGGGGWVGEELGVGGGDGRGLTDLEGDVDVDGRLVLRAWLLWLLASLAIPVVGVGPALLGFTALNSLVVTGSGSAFLFRSRSRSQPR
jgi:hypothetical protein